MTLNNMIEIVKEMASLKPSSQTDSYIDKLLKNSGFISQDGTPSRARLLGEIEKIGVEKVFKDISLDDRKNFLANISSAYRAFPDIQKIVQTSEMTTTANVAAYPIPIGRKKKVSESKKRMGIGSYEIKDNSPIESIQDVLDEEEEMEDIEKWLEINT